MTFCIASCKASSSVAHCARGARGALGAGGASVAGTSSDIGFGGRVERRRPVRHPCSCQALGVWFCPDDHSSLTSALSCGVPQAVAPKYTATVTRDSKLEVVVVQEFH